MIAIRAKFQAEQCLEPRRQPRRTLHLLADTWSVGVGSSAIIYNLSRGGMLIDSELELAVGDKLSVVLPEAGPVTAKVVWRHGSIAGCEFTKAISQAAMSAAILRAEPHIPGPHLHLKEISEAAESAGKARPIGESEVFLIFGLVTLGALAALAGLMPSLG